MRFVTLLIITLHFLYASTTIEFEKGWQLLGVSHTLENLSPFDNEHVDIIWGYDGETQSWRGFSPNITTKIKLQENNISSLNSLDSWQAIWIFSNKEWSYDFDNGTTPQKVSNNTIELYEGWNLIALPQNSVVDTSFFDDALVWKYNATDKWQVNDDSLNFPTIENIGVSEGLWVKSTKRQSIHLESKLSELHTFNSQEEMLEYIYQMTKLYNNTYYYDDVATVATEESSETTNDSSDDTTTTENASQTNLQENGVDEADILKHDGEYIYSVDNTNSQIIITSFSNLTQQNFTPIQTIQTEHTNILEMFLENNRLSVISQNYSYYYMDEPVIMETTSRSMVYPEYNNDNNVTLTIYDVSDVNAITKITQHTLDGHYQDSRLIDGKLFLITQFSPTSNDNAITPKSEDLIPSIQSDTQTKELLEPETFYAPYKLDQKASITSMSSFTTQSGVYNETLSFLGNTHTYYASTSSLYLVSNEYPLYYDFTHYKEQQMIYKFSLGSSLKYEGKGFVDGNMLSQFSMSEKDSYLRVATTQGNSWSSEGTINSLYTLKMEDSNLNIQATLSGLGKEGETIKAVRFKGDRAFIVTFRQTDPLYTIDLSDPLSPVTVGELSIPGFSEYLHIVDENRVLSLGRDADASGVAQGLQVQLFDISDFSNPTLSDKKSLGTTYSYSDVEYNHKAFTYRHDNKMFGIPYSDYSNNKYSENFIVYQIDDFKINELKTLNSTNSSWGNNGRGLLFKNNSTNYGALFKGSNIMCEVIE